MKKIQLDPTKLISLANNKAGNNLNRNLVLRVHQSRPKRKERTTKSIKIDKSRTRNASLLPGSELTDSQSWRGQLRKFLLSPPNFSYRIENRKGAHRIARTFRFKTSPAVHPGRIVGKLNNGSFVIGRVIADGSFPSVVLAPPLHELWEPAVDFRVNEFTGISSREGVLCRVLRWMRKRDEEDPRRSSRINALTRTLPLPVIFSWFSTLASQCRFLRTVSFFVDSFSFNSRFSLYRVIILTREE